MPLYLQGNSLLQKGGKLGTSAGCCCGGGGTCVQCKSVTKEAGPEGVQTNERNDPCRPQTISDFYLLCNRGAYNSLNPKYAQCSTIPNVPEAYANCTCMTFDQVCGTSDFANGVDDNGNCCTVIRSTAYYHYFTFVFLSGPCKWQRVLDYVYATDTYCFGDPLSVGPCSAECPAIRECENFCDGSFDGCSCNEFP